MAKAQLKKTLSRDLIRDLTAFLEALTGVIPAQALEVPILPAKE